MWKRKEEEEEKTERRITILGMRIKDMCCCELGCLGKFCAAGRRNNTITGSFGGSNTLASNAVEPPFSPLVSEVIVAGLVIDD